MASAFEQAFDVVQSLARDFDANKTHYLSSAYQESEVRKDFIDKFLITLGWDVNHDWQKNPFQQEAKVERGINVSGAARRADYAFYIAPNFRDVLENGYWHARSLDFIGQPLMRTLEWLRLPGDAVFILAGVVPAVLAAVVAWRFRNESAGATANK